MLVKMNIESQELKAARQLPMLLRKLDWAMIAPE